MSDIQVKILLTAVLKGHKRDHLTLTTLGGVTRGFIPPSYSPAITSLFFAKKLKFFWKGADRFNEFASYSGE